jgi:hypothetical protein
MPSPDVVDGDQRLSLNRGDRNWKTSSYSDKEACVEVSVEIAEVLVRNSRDRSRPALAFQSTAWVAFTDAVRGGEFGRPAGAGSMSSSG